MYAALSVAMVRGFGGLAKRYSRVRRISWPSITPSDNCMTNNRFQSMYALWTILSFNLLLSGDFANLNPFVMATWTNDLAVGIK